MKIIKDLTDEMTLLAEYPFYDKEAAAKAYVSVTGLLDTDRIFHLKRRHEKAITRKASSMIVASLGSVFHLGMELATQENDNYINEIRMFTPIMVNGQKVLISGKFDSLKIIEDKIGETTLTRLKLIDYKETSVFNVNKRDTNEKWAKQLSIYRYMLMNPETEFEENDPDTTKQVIKIRKLIHEQNIGISAIEVQYRARDWRKGEALRNKFTHNSYPDRVGRIALNIIKMGEVEKFIKSRLISLISFEDTKDEALPLCTAKERWQRVTDFAIFKGDNVRATKCFYVDNYKSEDEAKNAAYYYIGNHASGSEMKVIKRETKSNKCLEYCDVCDFCSYGRKLMEATDESE